MPSLGDLIIKLGADVGDFNAPLDAAHDKLGAFGEFVLDWGKKIAAGFSLAAIGEMVISTAESLENADIRIQRATGATGAVLDGLAESFRNVYAVVPASAEAISGAMDLIYQRTGATGVQLETLTTGMLQLARVGNEDVTSMAQGVEKAFQAWQVPLFNQTAAMGLFRIVAQQTGTSVGELTSNLAASGPAMQGLGYSFDQSAVLIGKFNQTTGNVEGVLKGMQLALKTFQKEGIVDTAQAWQDFVSGIKDGSIGTEEAVKTMGKGYLVTMTAIKAGALDTVDPTVAAFKKLASENVDDVRTMGEAWTLFKRTIGLALEPLTGPLFKDAARGIKDLGASVTDLVEAFKTLTPVMSGLAKTFDAFNISTSKWGETFGKYTGLAELGSQIRGLGTSMGFASNDAKTMEDAQQKLNQKLLDAMAPTVAITKSRIDQKAADGAAAKQLAELTRAMSESETGLRTLEELYKSTYVPTMYDVATAEGLVQSARLTVSSATDLLREAEDKLAYVIKNSPKDTAALTAATDDVKQSRANAKLATDGLTLSDKDLAVSLSATKAATTALAEADREHAAAMAQIFEPVVKSYAAAFADVVTAKRKVVEADQAMRASQQALNELEAVSGKQNKEAIIAETINLTALRLKVAEAMKVQGVAQKELTSSESLLHTANTELIADAGAIESLYKDHLTGSVKTFIASLDELRAAKQVAITASDDVRAAEQKLRDLYAQEKPDTAELAKATKDAAAARVTLNTATKSLSGVEQGLQQDFGVSRTAMNDVTTATDDLSKSAQNAENALSSLGIKSSAELQKLADKSAQAYAAIAGNAQVSDNQQRDAQIKMLEDAQKAAVAAGGDLTDAQQRTLDKMLNQQTYFNLQHADQWHALYVNISGQIDSLSKGLVVSLFEGDGSFGKKTIAALKGIGEAMVTAMIKPWTDAIANFIAGALTDLLSSKGLGGILDTLKSIGSAAVDVFKGLAKVAAPAVDTAVTAATDTTIAATNAAESGATSAASGATAAAGGVVGGWVSLISGAVSAISGVVGNFQNAHMIDDLKSIEHNTRYTMMYVGERADGGILGATFQVNQNVAKVNDTAGKVLAAIEDFRNKFWDWLGYLNPLLEQIRDGKTGAGVIPAAGKSATAPQGVVDAAKATGSTGLTLSAADLAAAVAAAVVEISAKQAATIAADAAARTGTAITSGLTAVTAQMIAASTAATATAAAASTGYTQVGTPRVITADQITGYADLLKSVNTLGTAFGDWSGKSLASFAASTAMFLDFSNKFFSWALPIPVKLDKISFDVAAMSVGLARMAITASGPGITVNVTGNTISNQAAADSIAQSIVDRIKTVIR